jgi:branched-chain amino acid transport system ATP-binding protein
MKPLLKLKDVSSFIGPFHILQGVSMEVFPGEAVVVLGRNGAGKTTTLRSIVGLVPPQDGQIVLDGVSLMGLPPYQAARQGIGYVPEDYGIFDFLSVEENLLIAMWKEDQATCARLDHVLELFPDLKVSYKRLASTLSGGQRQMLSIARALVNENKVILIDEPSKGLAPIIVEKVRDVLLKFKQQSTIVLVEQNFDLACAVGDRYYIINEGRTVLNGDVKELYKDVELQRKYLGVVSA